MRGLAAIAVGLMHFAHSAGYDDALTRANLAVDFFFALSGFVIAHSYTAKLRSGVMSPARFTVLRVIRLWPLIALSMLASYLVKACVALPFADDQAVAGGWLTFDLLSGLLLIPQALHIHGKSIQVYPLNNPAWSIFFELLINVAWAYLIIKLPKKAVLTSAAFAFAILVAYAIKRGAMAGGFNHGVNFLIGIPRVYFSFVIGLVVYSIHKRHHGLNVGFAPLAIVLSLALLIPEETIGPWYDLAVVAILMPAIVLLGANCERSIVPESLLRWFGEISFAFYAIHNVLLSGWTAASRNLLGSEPSLISLGILFCSTIAAAHWVHHAIDVPLRRRLISGFNQRYPLRGQTPLDERSASET